MSTNFAKTLVWKQDYDVILWRHKQRTPNTNAYPMPLNETPPMKSFCVRHWFRLWHFATKCAAVKLFVKPECRATSPNREIPATLVRPCVQNVPGKIGEASLAGYFRHPRESDPQVVQGLSEVTTSPTLLGPVLLRSQPNYLRLLLIVRYFEPSCCPHKLPQTIWFESVLCIQCNAGIDISIYFFIGTLDKLNSRDSLKSTLLYVWISVSNNRVTKDDMPVLMDEPRA